MTNRRYDSLRHKLIWPFVLLGLVVSALLSMTTYAIVAELEEFAVNRTLRVEVESFRNRKMQNPEALPPDASLLKGYLLPAPELPDIELPRAGADILQQMQVGERHYAVISADIVGAPYALLYTLEYVDARLHRLAIFLLIGTLLMTLLSYVIGNRLALQVVRPISRLLSEIAEKAGRAQPAASGTVIFSATDYPSNEIGHLVQALDDFALRLYGFVKRESYFASDVSHELRTPIAVIRGAAELLIETPDLSPASRQRILSIHRHAVRMAEMLEAMLLLAREDEDRGDPVCVLADVVDDVVADCEPLLAGRSVSIRTDIQSRTKLPVERSLAYVVISNLVRNAVSYTREGEILVRLSDDRLEVNDTGIGIPEERFAEIFKRHSKGAESAGAGIGLSIVSRVAELLNWQVELESERGKGTRVTVVFPQP
ncbi:MAG: HAMP domain-containing histidine kinase [Zoogloeaceae bacterium]|nr:HAMP domain-containing histidine kinase [Zoogloeaceae bacterium]